MRNAIKPIVRLFLPFLAGVIALPICGQLAKPRAQEEREREIRGERAEEVRREREPERERIGDRPRESERERIGDRPREPEGERGGDRPRQRERAREQDRPREPERERRAPADIVRARLQSDLLAAERNLEELAEQFGPRHPRLQAAKRSVERIKQQMERVEAERAEAARRRRVARDVPERPSEPEARARGRNIEQSRERALHGIREHLEVVRRNEGNVGRELAALRSCLAEEMRRHQGDVPEEARLELVRRRRQALQLLSASRREGPALARRLRPEAIRRELPERPMPESRPPEEGPRFREEAPEGERVAAEIEELRRDINRIREEMEELRRHIREQLGR
jgi:archaellum component FlaC